MLLEEDWLSNSTYFEGKVLSFNSSIFAASTKKKDSTDEVSTRIFVKTTMGGFKLLGIYNIILFLLRKPLYFMVCLLFAFEIFFLLFFLHC